MTRLLRQTYAAQTWRSSSRRPRRTRTIHTPDAIAEFQSDDAGPWERAGYKTAAFWLVALCAGFLIVALFAKYR